MLWGPVTEGHFFVALSLDSVCYGLDMRCPQTLCVRQCKDVQR